MTALTLAIMLLAIGMLWHVHASQIGELNSAIQKSELASKKMQLGIAIIESARARTRLIGEIIYTSDPFEQDRLNLELDGEAANFARAREALLALPLNDYEKELLDRQGQHAGIILPAQRHVTSMVMDDPENTREEATRLLYAVIFPGQGDIIDEVLELASYQKSIIDEAAAQAAAIERTFARVQRLTYGGLLLLATLLSVLVVQRTRRVERQLQLSRDDAELAYQQLHEHHQNLEVIVKQRTAELEKSKDEAIHANNAKSEFLSRMSHELRTPMNAILGFAQLLELDLLSKNQRDSIDEILKAGKHLLHLINEVLDLARIESGKADMSIEPVDIKIVIDECLALTRPMMEQRDITLALQLDSPPLWIKGDRVRLKQVIINLLSNAVKYNRDHGNITVRTSPGMGNTLRLSIADTGRGIPSEKIPLLFDAFNRLGAENSEIEGTGIGLSISKKLMSMMGGDIFVVSTEGQGSEFSIELPLTAALPPSETAAAGVQAIAIDNTEDDSAVVLYVEDNPANLRLVKSILLARPQITLISAHEPMLGLEFARHHRPHLILLDINLPQIDGFEVLRRLRADQHTAHIPVLAISASAMPKDIERAQAAGFAEYLTKPIDVMEFLGKVDHYLAATN